MDSGGTVESAWATVTCAGLIAVSLVYCSLHQVPLDSPRSELVEGPNRPRESRPTARDALFGLLFHAAILAFVAFTYSEGGWTPASIGVSATVPPALAFGAGALLFVPWSLAVRAFSVLLGRASLDAKAAFRVLVRRWPRGRLAQLLEFVATVLANPWTEEVIFRGMLIALPVRLGVPFPLAGLVGLLLSLCAHVYQGRRFLHLHALYFALFLCILVSPLGLIGAVGCHFVADSMPILRLRTYGMAVGKIRVASVPRSQPK